MAIGKKNTVKADLSNYSILFNGIAGIGKTTLFFDVAHKLYGEEGGLLISVGEEPRPYHIPDAFYDEVDTFGQLIKMVDELCKQRNGAYSNIRLVGIDTVDEVYKLAEAYVIAEYNSSLDDPSKRVNTIRRAYGGYRAGEDRVKDLVVKTLFKLRKYGYGLFMIGHTKLKAKRDKLEEVEYEQLTSNLGADYYNALKDKVNLVATAYVKRNFGNTETQKDQYTKKDKVVGELISEKRVIVFRDDEYAIDCKSHFADIVECCEFDTDTFITAITDAIKAQLVKQHKQPITDEKMKEIQQQQIQERDLAVGELIETEIKADEIQSEKEECEKLLLEIKDNKHLISKEQMLKIRDFLKVKNKKLEELDLEDLKIVYGLAQL